MNLGSYLLLLDFISLMLNDTLDSDQVVIVDERLFAIFLFFLFIAIYLYKRCTLPTKLIIDALPAVAKDLRIVFSFLLVTAKAIVWHHLVF